VVGRLLCLAFFVFCISTFAAAQSPGSPAASETPAGADTIPKESASQAAEVTTEKTKPVSVPAKSEAEENSGSLAGEPDAEPDAESDAKPTVGGPGTYPEPKAVPAEEPVPVKMAEQAAESDAKPTVGGPGTYPEPKAVPAEEPVPVKMAELAVNMSEAPVVMEPVHCRVSAWKNTTKCSRSCQGGIFTRSREVLQEAAYGGSPCPALSQTSLCNTHSCRMTPVRHNYEVEVWPMPRKDISTIADGDLTSWSYTTAAWCEHSPFWVALTFKQGTLISGLRMWKRHHPGQRRDCGTKDLVVLWGSERPGTEMSQRNLVRVKQLKNGFEGYELWNGTVDAESSKIFRDTHDSESSTWASVSFQTVNATALVLQVDSLDPHYNHMCIHELQAFQDSNAAMRTHEAWMEM